MLEVPDNFSIFLDFLAREVVGKNYTVPYTYWLMPKNSRFGSPPFRCYYSWHFVISFVDQLLKTASPNIGSPHKNQNFFTLHLLIWVKEESYSATSNFHKCWANSGGESLSLNKLNWNPSVDWWPSHWVTLGFLVLNGCVDLPKPQQKSQRFDISPMQPAKRANNGQGWGGLKDNKNTIVKSPAFWIFGENFQMSTDGLQVNNVYTV